MNVKTSQFEVIESKKDDRIDQFFIDHWGSNFIVSGKEKLYGKDLPFLMVQEDNKIIGLLTYHVDKNLQCEIVSFDSLRPSVGIGSKLLQRMINIARDKKYSRLWLMTSNDNIDAIKYYQKRGFILKAVHPNAIEKSRKLKQLIPKIGNYGIPIRDEIEFEYPL